MDLMKLKKCDVNRPYVFISYSSKNRDLVTDDVYELQRRGYNVWLDDKMLDKTQESWADDALKAITTLDCKLLIFYVSRSSLTSRPCLNEMLATISEKAKKYNRKDGKLKFIAVDAEIIDDFEHLLSELYDKCENGTPEDKKKYDVLYEMEEKFFNTGNAKVRIVNKNTPHRKIDYYTEIIDCIPDSVRIYEPETGDDAQEKGEPVQERVVDTKPSVVTAQPIESQESGQPVEPQEPKRPVALKEGEMPPEPDTPKGGEVTGKKKKASSTGDITYSIYGKEYIENQSDMMLRVFGKVLSNHPEAVETLPDETGMNCVSFTDYTQSENRTESMPSYFRVCEFFPIGKGICVGTAYSINDKLKKIARLFEICGEDPSIFSSDTVALPEKVSNRTGKSGAEEEYSIYGIDYKGNQGRMMIDALHAIVERHFDRIDNLCELTSIKKKDKSELEGITYFNQSETFEHEGVKYTIGASYGRTEKLKQIRKAIDICGDSIDNFVIDGLDNTSVPSSVSKRSKSRKNYLD